jgi:hypothetical protein
VGPTWSGRKRLTQTVANPVYATVNPETGVKLGIQLGATSDENFIRFLQSSLATRDKSGPKELEVASVGGAPGTSEAK